MRTWTPILATLALGCGPGLECGPGTIERDGQCVPVRGDDDDDAVSAGDDDDDDAVQSGPQAVVTPALYDFGPVGVGCPATATVAVTNGGDEDLVLYSLLYTTDGQTLTLDDGAVALPLTLPPGGGIDVRVDAVPVGTGPDDGRLSVGSNDPDGVVYADQGIEGVWGTQTDSFVVTTSQIDVLLLIDHSCSMEAQQYDDVQAGIPALVDALDLVGDWQIAEVTLDSGCVNGGIVDPTTPNGVQLLVDHAFDGAGGGGLGVYLTEALLQLASIALSKTDPGECNEGFLRPGTPLYILIVSDEREQSGMAPAVFVADYQGYVPGVVVSVVVDENVNCGDGSGGGGYVEAANATGGVVMNICGAWGPDMDDLVAGAPLSEVQVFDLTVPATAPPLEVLVDGVATVDFTWDAALNQLSVGGTLPEGTAIEVTYPVAATCTP